MTISQSSAGNLLSGVLIEALAQCVSVTDGFERKWLSLHQGGSQIFTKKWTEQMSDKESYLGCAMWLYVSDVSEVRRTQYASLV